MKCRMFRNLPFARMIDKRFDNVHRYCEIGIDKGISMGITFKNVVFDDLYVVDVKIDPVVKKKWSKFSYIHFYEMSSIDFFNMFPDNYFDVVWLDGNHSYEYLKKEIPVAWSKAKYVLGGHDFYPECPGVAKAVVEFKELNGFELKGICTNWWFQKIRS